MRVIYAVEDLPAADPESRVVPRSIFLAGPTPRNARVASWRPLAITLLRGSSFEGTVFVPECEGGGWHGVYEEQVHWEWRALSRAACVLFWVPRRLDTMPAFTTNVEFGLLAGLCPDRVVFGAPEDAPKTRYLRTMAADQSVLREALGLPDGPLIPTATNLVDALDMACELSHQ